MSTLNKVCTVLIISAVVAFAAMYFCKKPTIDGFNSGLANNLAYSSGAYPNKNLWNMYNTKSNAYHYKMLPEEGELPIACVATLGGDIMMCPSSGICPLNGARCQASPDSKPCCTDWYYPQSTMDMLYAQHHNHTMLTM